jgi:hypothetical protein
MSISGETPLVVRPGTSWKTPVMFGAAAFLVTVLAVQFRVQNRTQVNSGNNAPVTVAIEHNTPVFPHLSSQKPTKDRLASPSITGNRAQTAGSSKTVQQLKDQLTSPDLLRQAWQDCKPSKMERFRQTLDVRVEESPRGGQTLRMTIAWPSPKEAASVLKFLAEQYSSQYQTTWRNAREREYNEAKSAALQAGQGYEEAAVQYQFFEAWLARKSTASERSNAPSKAGAALRPLDSRLPKEDVAQPRSTNSEIENPEWSSVQRDLSALREKEAILLEKRTAIHPEVKRLQEKIHDCETRLTSIPRWMDTKSRSIGAPTEDGSGAGLEMRAESPRISDNNSVIRSPNTTDSSPSQKAANEAADDEWIIQLENDVETAAEAYTQALAREKLAHDRCQLAPSIAVRVWGSTKIAATASLQREWAWWAGAIMAIGFGLIFAGKTIEPPVASLDELQRLAAVPIVGVVPSYTPSINPQTVKRRKNLLRFGLFFSGLILVGLCFAAVIRFC